jgi:hypothetical protein
MNLTEQLAYCKMLIDRCIRLKTRMNCFEAGEA